MGIAVIKNEVKIVANEELISIQLDFFTKMICTYRLQVKEHGVNKPLYEWQGDNTNVEDDLYELGIGVENLNRTVWLSLTLLDQTGEGGEYEMKAVIMRDYHTAPGGLITTGQKILPPGTNKADFLFVVKLKE